MAATKTATTVVSSQSSAAGSAINAVTGSQDLTTAYGAIVTAKVTNGATGPTVACTVELDYSNDNTNWKVASSNLAQTGNSVVTTFVFYIPPQVMYYRIGFGGNTAQAVTVEAQSAALTGI
jgi:hypothetical protein